MPRPTLSRSEIDAALAALPGWEHRGDRLHREFRFADFRAAFAFMTAVAEVAERMQHHPDWSNSYGRVAVELTTHDAGGVTAADLELARAMEECAGGAIG